MGGDHSVRELTRADGQPRHDRQRGGRDGARRDEAIAGEVGLGCSDHPCHDGTRAGLRKGVSEGTRREDLFQGRVVARLNPFWLRLPHDPPRQSSVGLSACASECRLRDPDSLCAINANGEGACRSTWGRYKEQEPETGRSSFQPLFVLGKPANLLPARLQKSRWVASRCQSVVRALSEPCRSLVQTRRRIRLEGGSRDQFRSARIPASVPPLSSGCRTDHAGPRPPRTVPAGLVTDAATGTASPNWGSQRSSSTTTVTVVRTVLGNGATWVVASRGGGGP